VHPLLSGTYRALLAGTNRIHSNSYMNTHRQHCARRWKTMQIGNNYFNDGHVPPERPCIVGDRVLPCRPPHGNNMSFNSVSQRSRLTPGIAVSFVVSIAARHTTTHIADCHGSPRHVLVRGGRQCGWSSAAACADLTLMSLHAACYFLQNRYGRFADADSPMFQHAPM